MICERLQGAFNNHITAETYSAYLYLSMSAWFERQGLRGFAHWLRLQAQEELIHGFKMFGFLNDRGGTVVLQSIEAPPSCWTTPLEVFQSVCEHEQTITQRINELVDLCLAEHDHAANAFLQWFVTEQVEEEATTSDLANKLRLVDGDGRGLLMLDQELARRALTLPAGVDLSGPLAR